MSELSEETLLRLTQTLWEPADTRILALDTNLNKLHLYSYYAPMFDSRLFPFLWYGAVKYRNMVVTPVLIEGKTLSSIDYYLGAPRPTQSKPDSIVLAEYIQHSLTLLRTYPLELHCSYDDIK